MWDSENLNLRLGLDENERGILFSAKLCIVQRSTNCKGVSAFKTLSQGTQGSQNKSYCKDIDNLAEKALYNYRINDTYFK